MGYGTRAHSKIVPLPGRSVLGGDSVWQENGQKINIPKIDQIVCERVFESSGCF